MRPPSENGFFDPLVGFVGSEAVPSIPERSGFVSGLGLSGLATLLGVPQWPGDREPSNTVAFGGETPCRYGSRGVLKLKLSVVSEAEDFPK